MFKPSLKNVIMGEYHFVLEIYLLLIRENIYFMLQISLVPIRETWQNNIDIHYSARGYR